MKAVSMMYLFLQACGSRGKALLEKAIRNKVGHCSQNTVYLYLSGFKFYFVCNGDILLTQSLILTWLWWMCLVGTTAGEQCFGQRTVLGSEDFVCGWYPFDSLSGDRRRISNQNYHDMKQTQWTSAHSRWHQASAFCSVLLCLIKAEEVCFELVLKCYDLHRTVSEKLVIP